MRSGATGTVRVGHAVDGASAVAASEHVPLGAQVPPCVSLHPASRESELREGFDGIRDERRETHSSSGVPAP